MVRAITNQTNKIILILIIMAIFTFMNYSLLKKNEYVSFLSDISLYLSGGLSFNSFMFNANSWITATSNDIFISLCQELNQNGRTYYLTQSISTGSACINITANDITLDCQGYEIAGNNVGNGISISRTTSIASNVYIKNCHIKSFYNGLMISNADGNTIENSIFEDNVRNGIYYSYSKQNIISNSYSYDNWHYDLYMDINSIIQCENAVNNLIGSGNKPILYYNHQVTLSDMELAELILCNADNSYISDIHMAPGYGNILKNRNSIFLYYTDNSEFDKLSISMALYSFAFKNSHYNTVLNSYFDLVQYDHMEFIDSNYNTVTSNTLLYNDINIGTRAGDAFTFLAGRNNNIYNNYFYNAEAVSGVDIRWLDSGSNNLWGATLTAGTNIMGGIYIGGNCWRRASGTGYSQQCADANSDGICDAPYTLNAVNVEDYPLKC